MLDLRGAELKPMEDPDEIRECEPVKVELDGIQRITIETNLILENIISNLIGVPTSPEPKVEPSCMKESLVMITELMQNNLGMAKRIQKILF